MTSLTDEIERFLETMGKDRQWLADEIGCAKGTLNNWFAKKGEDFPLWAQKSIARLISEKTRVSVPDDSALKFSLPEWEKIQQAAQASGSASITEFVKGALLARAEELNNGNANGR